MEYLLTKLYFHTHGMILRHIAFQSFILNLLHGSISYELVG